MRRYFFLMILAYTEALAQIPKKAPILIPLGKESQGYLAYSDLQELRNYILAGLGGLCIFMIKSIFNWWKERNDTTAIDEKAFKKEVRDALNELKNYALIHKYELEHLKESKASKSEVHELLHRKINFEERKK